MGPKAEMLLIGNIGAGMGCVSLRLARLGLLR
jgi:hypothetical protein